MGRDITRIKNAKEFWFRYSKCGIAKYKYGNDSKYKMALQIKIEFLKFIKKREKL